MSGPRKAPYDPAVPGEPTSDPDVVEPDDDEDDEDDSPDP